MKSYIVEKVVGGKRIFVDVQIPTPLDCISTQSLESQCVQIRNLSRGSVKSYCVSKLEVTNTVVGIARPTHYIFQFDADKHNVHLFTGNNARNDAIETTANFLSGFSLV